jgi:hypothetical protein
MLVRPSVGTPGKKGSVDVKCKKNKLNGKGIKGAKDVEGTKT